MFKKKITSKNHRKFYLIFFRIEILLHLGVPDNQILLHFSVPDNQILLFSVSQTTKFYSILVSPTTDQWIYPPSHAWATREVVGDTQML